MLVPGEGFEPPTFGLQNRCTATVLTRRYQRLRRSPSPPEPGFATYHDATGRYRGSERGALSKASFY